MTKINMEALSEVITIANSSINFDFKVWPASGGFSLTVSSIGSKGTELSKESVYKIRDTIVTDLESKHTPVLDNPLDFLHKESMTKASIPSSIKYAAPELLTPGYGKVAVFNKEVVDEEFEADFW